MFSVKMHKHPSGYVLAVCDEELLGQSFSEGRLRLNVGRGFYGGEVVGESVLVAMFADASTLNLVGEKAVAVAIREGLVDPERTIAVSGIPHAQVLM